MEQTINGKTIRLIQGDLTELDVDAIVNAANSSLILGGGVAGAIRTKGGPSIQQECDQIGGTYVGGAVTTGAGKLKARYVIHAVGPRMGEGDEDAKLQSATLESLKRATEKGMASIAFPAVSTGIFGFPKDRCADIMLKTAIDFLTNTPTSLREVVFCLFAKADLDLFETHLRKLAPR